MIITTPASAVWLQWLLKLVVGPLAEFGEDIAGCLRCDRRQTHLKSPDRCRSALVLPNVLPVLI